MHTTCIRLTTKKLGGMAGATCSSLSLLIKETIGYHLCWHPSQRPLHETRCNARWNCCNHIDTCMHVCPKMHSHCCLYHQTESATSWGVQNETTLKCHTDEPTHTACSLAQQRHQWLWKEHWMPVTWLQPKPHFPLTVRLLLSAR